MKKATKNLFFASLFIFSASMFAQDHTEKINKHFEQTIKKLSPQDAQWKVTSENTSRATGIQHLYFRQTLNGLEIYGTESGLHLLPNGKSLSADSRFVKDVAQKATGPVSPSLTAIQAVQAAAGQLQYTVSEPLKVIEQKRGNTTETILSDGGFSLSPIPVKLMYLLTKKEQIILVWDISIQEKAQQNWWSLKVDATTGKILDKTNWMVSCNLEHDHANDVEQLNYNTNLFDIPNYKATVDNALGCNECYEVFSLPMESPYYGNRTIEALPADPTASPFGWHDTNGVAGAEFTVTRGNNVDAYEDGNNSGYQPEGGANLDFTGFPFDQMYSNATQYEDAAITNLFYMNNILHDILYQYGFDEISGNFQENNYGNGGAGSDSVNAEAQDGSGTCNANFGTPPDGSSPTMQMYICNSKDGDYDNLVISHELGHGVSNRLTGGPANTSCLDNTEQMGEGWSDFFGTLITIEAGDAGTDARAVGTYLFGQGINGPGIRTFKYSTDMAVNPHTYDDIKTEAVPHGVGSVWAMMIWEMTWGLIDEHGFDPDIYTFTGDVNQDAGNIMAMALVIEGMKLQPCSPGFVDGRDAILAADIAIYGGANQCIIWEAFAKRGLGMSADQGSSNSRSDGTEAFDLPDTSLETAEEVCVSEGVQIYGGGSPAGGVYSGTGVTDNGDGLTYSFDPAVAGIGTHTITYDAVSLCTTSSQATDTIEVTDEIPDITCQNITLELDENGEAILEMGDVVTNLLPGNMVIDQTGTFAPIDISGGTAVNLSDDQVSNALPIGFTFNFYSQDYSNFYISSNGFMTFSGSTDDGCCSGGLLPAVDDVNNIIAMAWEDVNPSSGGTIRYQTVGTSPNRKLIMEFDNVPFYGGSGSITSQIHLFETSNRIEIHSTNISANGNTTQGIENATGTEGIPTPGRNSQVWSANNDYVAFYYTPGAPADNCGSPTTITLSDDFFTCDDIGENTITVTITDGNGNTATCTPTITVEDNQIPVITDCPVDVVVEVPTGQTFTLPDYTGDVSATDNCPTTITQSPVAGTALGIGVATITMTATDGSGNSITCTFTVTVEEILGIEDNEINNNISLYPNPTTGSITLSNKTNMPLQNAVITDVRGRVIQVVDLTQSGMESSFSMESLASGMYFVKINAENFSIVKRVIKK